MKVQSCAGTYMYMYECMYMYVCVYVPVYVCVSESTLIVCEHVHMCTKL